MSNFKSKSSTNIINDKNKLSTKFISFVRSHPNTTFYGGLLLLVFLNIFFGLKFISEVALILINVRLLKSFIGYFLEKNSLILLSLGILLGSLIVAVLFFEIPVFLLIPDSFIVAYLTGIFLTLLDIYEF